LAGGGEGRGGVDGSDGDSEVGEDGDSDGGGESGGGW